MMGCFEFWYLDSTTVKVIVYQIWWNAKPVQFHNTLCVIEVHCDM